MIIAVLDVGKTRIKMSAVTLDGEVLESLSTPNASIPGPYYQVAPLERIERFLVASLRELGERHDIGAIMPTTHGSSGALLNHDGSITPLPDYETPIPDWLEESYSQSMDPYEERRSVLATGASHLAKQLFWLDTAHPDVLARARWLLPSPQYWAWRLCGVVAMELSSLSASSHLWNSLDGHYAGIVARRNWSALMPDIRPAGEILGTLAPEIAARTGLAKSTRVYCGVHDSTANFYRFQALGLENFALLSTGTWMLGMTDRIPYGRLRASSNLTVHVLAQGNLFASIKAMAGREFGILCPEPGGKVAATDIAATMERGVFALPSFVRSAELIPGSSNRGRIIGPQPQAPIERESLAVLYACMLADLMLDRLESAGSVIIDGIFAEQPLFCELLSSLRQTQSVRVAPSQNGTAAGAALLARPASGHPIADNTREIPGRYWPELRNYRDQWRELATQPIHEPERMPT